MQSQFQFNLSASKITQPTAPKLETIVDTSRPRRIQITSTSQPTAQSSSSSTSSNTPSLTPAFSLRIPTSPGDQSTISVHQSKEEGEKEEQQYQLKELQKVKDKFNAHQFVQAIDLAESTIKQHTKPLSEFYYYIISAQRALGKFEPSLSTCFSLMKTDPSPVLVAMKTAATSELEYLKAKANNQPYHYYQATKSRLSLNTASAVDYDYDSSEVIIRTKENFLFPETRYGYDWESQQLIWMSYQEVSYEVATAESITLEGGRLNMQKAWGDGNLRQVVYSTDPTKPEFSNLLKQAALMRVLYPFYPVSTLDLKYATFSSEGSTKEIRIASYPLPVKSTLLENIQGHQYSFVTLINIALSAAHELERINKMGIIMGQNLADHISILPNINHFQLTFMNFIHAEWICEQEFKEENQDTKNFATLVEKIFEKNMEYKSDQALCKWVEDGKNPFSDSRPALSSFKELPSVKNNLGQLFFNNGKIIQGPVQTNNTNPLPSTAIASLTTG